MKKVLCGPVGTGKTSRLKNIYHQLVQQGAKTGEILVLVMNASTVSAWRAEIMLETSANLHIFTYFGFAQREVTRNWSRIGAGLAQGLNTAQLTFMTAETAHYLMGLLVDKYRAEGYFPQVRATSQQIAIQLIDNLNQAALNGLSIQAAGSRLVSSAWTDKVKQATFTQAVELMSLFRQDCLTARCLDYSLTIELFNRELLSNSSYQEGLLGSTNYLLVDNLEETVPVAQELILSLIDSVKDAYLAYDPNGGHSNFFGADPQLAKQRLFPLCTIEQFGAVNELSGLAACLADKIRGKETQGVINAPGLKGQIVTQLRGQMLNEVAVKIGEMVARGIPADEIAVLAPNIDKVLEFTLQRQLASNNISLVALTRSKRLLDQSFAQALVSLALLVYPEWNLELNFSGLVQTLSILLDIDPVRSSLLTEMVFQHRLELPDLDATGLRSRLGFSNSEKYDHLKEWLVARRREKPDLETLFQRVFGELLAPLLPGEHDLLACRQVIDSVCKFNRVIDCFPIRVNKGRGFLDMVLRGTLAAETLFRPPENLGKVILTTPYTFLFSPHVTKVSYQFWLDVGSEQWLKGSAKELTNPSLLSPSWEQDRAWDDQVDREIRTERLAGYILSLLGRTKLGVYTATSYFNSQGYEQEGLLAQCLEDQVVIDGA